MQWQPMSRSTPPPDMSFVQNQSLWGPGWVSRERAQVTCPTAPAFTACNAFRSSEYKQDLKVPVHYSCNLHHVKHLLCLVAFLPRGFVQNMAFPASAASLTASRWRLLGSPTTTRSTSGSLTASFIEADHLGMLCFPANNLPLDSSLE